jgi:hypothetical protein
MNTHPFHTALVLLSTLLLVGCDIVENPVAPGTGGGPGGGGEGVTRKVLLEEFTGHRCNSCPAAHLVAAQLKNLYPDEFVVVGIHATNTFAAPANPPNPNGSYATDFRTPAASTYINAFGVTFLPTGMINRMVYNGSITISHDAWGSASADLIGQPADLDIWFSELQPNAANNTVSAVVKVAVLNPLEGDLNMAMYLTEDHVIDWQLNSAANPPDIPDYDHRHVLRSNPNGTWGVPAFSGTANVGDTLTFSYPDIAVDPAWNADNCSLVAYVYNTTTYEVVQAAERKFVP